MCAFVVLVLVFSIPGQETGVGKRLRNDLFCVEWDVKPQLNESVNQPLSWKAWKCRGSLIPVGEISGNYQNIGKGQPNVTKKNSFKRKLSVALNLALHQCLVGCCESYVALLKDFCVMASRFFLPA